MTTGLRLARLFFTCMVAGSLLSGCSPKRVVFLQTDPTFPPGNNTPVRLLLASPIDTLNMAPVRDQMVRPFLGHHGDRYVPLLASFFVYILFCNLLGLVPFLDFLGSGGNTATGNLGITAAVAICAFVSYHVLGIREQGFFKYVRNMFPQVPFYILPIIVPVELMAHVVRPCALAVRLFANMLAGHTLVAAILGFTLVLTKDFVIPGGAISLLSAAGVTALTFLELLVACIQAFVFTFLLTCYISGAVHPEH